MNYPSDEVISQLKKDIKSGALSGVYGDYILMTELWHCPPSEFEKQTEYDIILHKYIFSLKGKQEQQQSRREELKRKALKNG